MSVSEKYPIHESIFPDSIPPLYHYTSTSGLLGMLKAKSIWFTQFSFSNDTAESTYAKGLISAVYERVSAITLPRYSYL
jgi:hypothetical protein